MMETDLNNNTITNNNKIIGLTICLFLIHLFVFYIGCVVINDVDSVFSIKEFGVFIFTMPWYMYLPFLVLVILWKVGNKYDFNIWFGVIAIIFTVLVIELIINLIVFFLPVQLNKAVNTLVCIFINILLFILFIFISIKLSNYKQYFK